MTDKLVLIDLSSISRPIYESLIDQSSAGTQIVAKVRALASAHRHVAICCDSRKSFRKELDASYKANRGETPGVYLHQLGLAVETLQADGFPIWQVDGFEADDVIATAVKAATEHSSLDGENCMWCGGPHAGGPEYCNTRALIISADKDLLQLVSERVEQFRPANGATAEKTYDVAAVREKFGVDPHQMADYLALVGDKSDNIIGAKGIGAVGAAKLLNQFGNIDDIYAAMDTNAISVTPAIMSSLLEFKARLPLVRQLIALRTDVPIPFEQIFTDRVPQDVASFGPEDDIEATMQPLEAALEELTKSNPSGFEPAAQSDGMGVKVAPRQPQAAVLDPVGPSSLAVREAEVLLAPVEWDMQFEARSILELKEVAKILFDSRIFSAWGSPQAVFAILQAGRELGMKTQQSLRAFDNIDGKPAMKADLIRALVMSSGKAEYFVNTERTAEAATFTTKRKGDPEPVSLRYTMADAEAAGRVKPGSGYKKDPADMLVARSSSKLARLVYADVVHGMIAKEEME